MTPTTSTPAPQQSKPDTQDINQYKRMISDLLQRGWSGTPLLVPYTLTMPLCLN
jgi:hypothetical protein